MSGHKIRDKEFQIMFMCSERCVLLIFESESESATFFVYLCVLVHAIFNIWLTICLYRIHYCWTGIGNLCHISREHYCFCSVLSINMIWTIMCLLHTKLGTGWTVMSQNGGKLYFCFISFLHICIAVEHPVINREVLESH
jgi:hypothetical protein